MKAPGEGSLRDLLDVAQPIAMQGFDRARPLWSSRSSKAWPTVALA